MKQVYSSIKLQTGDHNGGVASIKIAPKQWLNTDVIIDFNTGKIITPVLLSLGHSWLDLEFIPNSYDYDEKPKSNKSGSYYEVTAAGTINFIDASLQQILESLRYNQFVCQVMDRNKRIKIAGNKEFGMLLQLEHKNTNAQSGVQSSLISLYLETEDAPPFYEI